jgi:hypothetical protein
MLVVFNAAVLPFLNREKWTRATKTYFFGGEYELTAAVLSREISRFSSSPTSSVIFKDGGLTGEAICPRG